MLSKQFQKRIIVPIKEEAVNEALEKIRKKFKDIQKETIFISIFVLIMMMIFPLIFPENTAKLFTTILLWGVFLYSIYQSYKKRQDIFDFFKIHSLEKFIYQKIYSEVKKEIDTKLKNKSTIENLLFNTFGESKSLLAHKISTDIHKMSQEIIRYNLMILFMIIITYYGIRAFLAYQNYHLNILELMFFSS